jgi:FkbM family methyltransferase
MNSYYSQHGEDYLLWQLFQNQPSGYFVEVGALDGLRFSNTYSFEQAGWQGICVEAHPDYIDLLNKNRPASINIFAAAAERDGEVTFYTNSRGSLSTLDPSLEAHFASTYGESFTGFEPVTVPMRRLDSILSEHNAPTDLEVVSIDVEGAEMRVLAGLDLRRYSPRILIIEASASDFLEITSHMEKMGYIYARHLRSNIFFCRDAQDVDIIETTDINCEVIHTPHMLDDDHVPQHKKIHYPAKPSRYPRFIGRIERRIKHIVKKFEIRR